MACLNLDSRSNSACIFRKLEKHSQAFAVDILIQSTFHTEPYCTCLAPDHFNVIQGWLFQAFSRSRWWAKSPRISLVLSLVIPILCAFGQNFGTFEWHGKQSQAVNQSGSIEHWSNDREFIKINFTAEQFLWKQSIIMSAEPFINQNRN